MKITVLAGLCLLATASAVIISPCPVGFVYNDGYCYAFSSSKVSWASAADIAVNISNFQLIVDFLARLRSVVCHCFLSDRLTNPAICSQFDSTLTEVDSQEENDFIALEMRQRRVTIAWIGGTDQLSDNYWIWAGSGNDFSSYSNWYPPSAFDLNKADNCLAIDSNHNYQWDKDRCNREFSFVCKRKAKGTVVG